MSNRVSRRSLITGAAALGATIVSKPLWAADEKFAQELGNELKGMGDQLFTGDPARTAASQDFGEIIHRQPIAVLKPRTAEDIVKVVELANRRGIKVAMRGRGHSMFGQAQAEGGVVVDSSTLSSVRLINFGGARAIEAEAGADWGRVLDLAYTEKLTPVVNVDSVQLSVGGTLSTAGYGGTTWRDGFQTDHVLELQLVTGQGKIISCSDDRDSELFNAALGGMGQCGLITKAIIKLAPARTHVRFFLLGYPDLESVSADKMALVNDGRFDHVEARTTPRKGGGFIFNLEAGSFYDEPNAPDDAKLLTGLKFESQAPSTMTFASYYRRLPPSTSAPHPFLYLCLPASKFPEFGKRVFATPAEYAYSSPRISFWRRSGITRPLTRVPDEDIVVRFQFGRSLPSLAEVPEALAANRTLYERAREIGGTRLSTAAIPFTENDWVRHFGSAWKSFSASKKLFDPNNVLTPGPGIFSS
jgi:FAD/FMN-containing dehydrogenase